MGRVPRSTRQHGWHHVMNRGGGRRDIFLSDHDRVDFGQVLGESMPKHGVEVHAYCLMPNHFHLLVRCPDGGLSVAMQHLSAVFTRHANDRNATDGPLMRGRFTSKVVDSDDYLAAAFRYIHLNPVPVLGGRSLEAYRWSSLRTYLGHRRPPEWLQVGSFLEWFGGSAGVGDLMRSGGGGSVSAQTIETLAEFGLAEAGYDGAATTRTVMLLLADLVPEQADEIIANLGFATPRLAQRARARARRRAGQHGELAAVLEAVARCTDRRAA